MARSLRRTTPGQGGLLRMAERTGMRKGLGGSKGWFYLGTGLWTVRTIRRLAADKEEILISETLKPGERIVISNALTPEGEALARPTRRQARKARKAEKRRGADA
ncbi:MAG: hypothetical protein KDA97_09520 [Acidimicrobiales bacterium]|nr:hypothetical protein [Acidimicrobiales bacterium]